MSKYTVIFSDPQLSPMVVEAAYFDIRQGTALFYKGKTDADAVAAVNMHFVASISSQ